jgi:hypothetical protein
MKKLSAVMCVMCLLCAVGIAEETEIMWTGVYTDEDLVLEACTDSSNLAAELEIHPPSSMTFYNSEDSVVGIVTWEDGTLRFEGDVEESAKVFFEYFWTVYINPGATLDKEPPQS